MTYSKTVYQDGVTPITATTLNNAEDQIEHLSSYGLGEAAADVSNSDLNDILETGFYRGNGLTNVPLAGDWYFIEVITHYNTNWALQKVTTFGASGGVKGGLSFSRVLVNGVWDDWKEFVYKGYVGEDPAYSWNGTINTGTYTDITHDLGYYPIIDINGTRGNIIMTKEHISTSVTRVHCYSSGGSNFTGNVYFW